MKDFLSLRQLSQPGIQLNSMAMVNVRVKSRISNQESSVDEDEMRFERRDTMDARDPAGAPKVPFFGFVWFRIVQPHSFNFQE